MSKKASGTIPLDPGGPFDLARLVCERIVVGSKHHFAKRLAGKCITDIETGGGICVNNYENISHWCHPKPKRPFERPLFRALSCLLFGEVIEREHEGCTSA